MLKGKCKELFIEMGDYTDAFGMMDEFINLIQEFVKWNRGEVRLALINLSDYGFPDGEMFVAYDDMTQACLGKVFSTNDFLDLMIETYNEYDDEEYLEAFWVPALTALLYD